MTLTVSRGIEDALAPPPAPTPPKQKPPTRCGASEWVGQPGRAGKRVWCSKPAGHDDPFAEIGGRQTDPIHEAIEHVGPVRIAYTWRSNR